MNARWAYLRCRYHLVRRLLASTKHVRKVQHDVLFRKLRGAADSDYGHDHGLRSVQSTADFRRQLPITTFDYYRPYVERVKQGDVRAMFGSKTRVLMFAVSSGTTDKPKNIPVTEAFFRDYGVGWRIWGLQTHADHRDLLRKKYVHLASDWQQYSTPCGIWCGNISGLAAATRPSVTRHAFVLPPEVGKIPDWQSRQYISLRLSLASRRVGMIITANPLTLVGLARLADAQKESLLRDLHDGTVAHFVQVPDAVRRRLAGKLIRRHPVRARELARIIARTGTLYPRDFWPEMSVAAVWTGGAAGAFLPLARRYYGNVAFRDHGLSASEGRITIPMSDGTSAGILDLHSNYYEFIPYDQYDQESPTVLEAHELEEGKSYYVLLTTSSGFFRYDIQDVVRCVGFEGFCPVLEFLHKGAHCANLAGEKLTEYQVVTAVKRAFDDLEMQVDTVTLAPVLGDPPRYVLFTESKADDANQQLAQRINEYLCQLNCEYANRLQTRRLRPLTTRVLPPGAWAAIREQRVACNGGSHEQYKHVFLSSQPDMADQLVRAAVGLSCDHRHHLDVTSMANRGARAG